MAAITALTAQNTRGVRAVHVPAGGVPDRPAGGRQRRHHHRRRQDRHAGRRVAVIDAVRGWLQKARPAVVVLDPVMVATSGDRLLQEAAEAALRALLPLADLDHAEPRRTGGAAGRTAPPWTGPRRWTKASGSPPRTGTTVLVKGGHLDGGSGRRPGDGCPDALVNTGGLLGAGRVVVPGERMPPATATAPAARCPRRWPRVQARRGGLGGGPARGQALAAEALRDAGGARRRNRQRPGPSFPPRPAARPGHGTVASGPAEGDFAVASGKPPAATLTRSTAWTSSGPSPTAPCRRRSSPITSPRTPFTSTAIPVSWPVPPPSRPPRPSSSSGPARRSNCLEVESELHRTWLSTRPAQATTGPVTKSYVDHLLAASVVRQLRGAGGRGAAVLLALRRGRGVPARAVPRRGSTGRRIPTPCGCATYADEDFAAATRQAIAYTDAAARAASAGGAARHDPGLPAVLPLRGGLLRRAAAARLTRRPGEPVR